MRVGNGGMRNPGPIVIDIERGRNELSELIPEVGQAQIGKMGEKNDQGEADG
jgi:hypothetical protein